MEEQTTTQVTVIESNLPEILKAEIDSQIATAKAFPRSLKVFMDRAESMATVSEEVAESCRYALPREGKQLEGPSVRLAEIVVSCYGNIRAGARVVSNDGKKITAQGICHDLETNYCITVEVSRRITKKDGRTFSEDMQVVTGNAAAAIAFRNAVFKVVPFAVVQPIFDKAKQVARGTAETLVKRRDKALEYFRSIGVKDTQICEALEIKKVEDIDLDKLATLTGMRSAIRNGETTARDLFEKQDQVTAEDLQLLLDMKRSVMTPEDVEAAERIIKNREAVSYGKVFKLMQSL